MKIHILILLSLVCSYALAAPQEVFWEDLQPADYVPFQAPVQHDGSMQQLNLDAPVVEKYNGKQVKVPGFIVPIETSNQLTTEFLLVPFFGACIHVPPPPPNQIIYVKYPQGVPIATLQDAVWVTGVLSTKGWQGELAVVGYSMQADKINAYDG